MAPESFRFPKKIRGVGREDEGVGNDRNGGVSLCANGMRILDFIRFKAWPWVSE
jgi:hypothetical protein